MVSNSNVSCPDTDQLIEFARGNLAYFQLEAMANHIDECPRCGAKLDELARQHSTGLVGELRGLSSVPSTKGASQGCDVPVELVEAVRNVVEHSPHSVSLDAGRRLASRLLDGPVRLGRFELRSELGAGAFGYVFKAYDVELDRFVALKVQRAGAFANDEEIERFFREAQSIAQLNHPGIVAVYDSVRSEEGLAYLVTEYVEGESLETAMASSEFSFRESAVLLASIADALQYAHDHGVIHRDVKPSNILIDQSGCPHITDFGLAKRAQEVGNTMTSLGKVMGTPAYMSPEQAIGDSPNVNSRSDIYSLGVTLYELLSGERPFQGNRQMLLLQVLEDEPRSPRKLKTSIPLDLETICLKAISKNPQRRYQSAAELAGDLRRFLKGEPIKARPIGIVEKCSRWCRSYPIAASLLLAAPIISIGGFVYLSTLSTQFVNATALESTRMEANMLEDINEFYSESVIGPLDQAHVPVTHHYASTENSVPLPFTFMIDAGKRISQGESGMQVKVYSDYPWRADSAKQDSFELAAIRELGLGCRVESEDARTSTKADVDGRSYHEFVEIGGEPMLRYARAQIMKPSCVQCHNSDVTSPKRDWVVGEVGGVLSITRPLKRDIESTKSGFRSAFHLIGWAASLLTGLTLFVFWSSSGRSVGSSKGAHGDQ